MGDDEYFKNGGRFTNANKNNAPPKIIKRNEYYFDFLHFNVEDEDTAGS